MELKRFAERLKDLRQENNLSQTQLANILQLGHSTISKWELQQRVPTLLNIVALCKYFKVSADYLIGLED